MAQKAVKMPSAHGHTAGIFADMSVDGPQIGTLVIIFDRAKNLPNRKTLGKQNPYVAARLGKEAKKTDTDMRGGQTPRWDQEIRYTVHESPDYLQLKVSVFNDDKKTDLIGETWVDLSSVIIPGGGQSDSWHELRYRNKYAGDIRLEMTYYDTRPEDEAVIERRTVVAEKPQSRSNNSVATVTPTTSSSLSGPRQPRPIKRRPLPDDPTGAAPSQAPPAAALPPATSAAPPQEFPIPALIHTQTQPPRPNPDPRQAARQTQDPRPVSRHNETPSNQGGLQMNHYAYDSPTGGPIPLDQFDDLNHAQSYSSDDFHHNPSRDMQQQSYYPPDDNHDNVRDFRTYQRASHGGNEFHPQHSSQPRSSHHDEGLYGSEAAMYMNSRHPTQTIMQDSVPNLYREPSTYEEQHDPHHFENSIAQPDPRRQSPLRQLMSPDDDRPAYSAMQPTVEDENDDGPPPPPPVHRTAIGRNMPSSASIDTEYKPYSPQESTSPHPDFRDHHRQSSISPAEQDLAVSMAKPSQMQTRPPYPQSAGISVPSSLAAGYDAAKDQVDGSLVQSADPRYGYSSGATTSMEPARYMQSTAPPQTALMKVQRSSPTPIMDRPRSISPNPRPLSYRKSVSPRPPSRDERDVSSVPFSPDSFDSYNPRRSPSATRETGSQYAPHDRTVETAKPSPADLDDGPIIGDDGRLIDPSDHLPLESWAPEPEKKTKKPEVIVRFKHNPQNASYASRIAARDPHYSALTAATASTAPDIAVRSSMRPRSTYVVQQPRQGYERHQRTSTTTSIVTSYTPPRQSTRDFERRDPYSQSLQHKVPSPRTYDTPPRRRSVSPNPQMRSSPIYSYADSGPPLPAKVPIAAPVSSYAGHGMDALSQEIQSIDIGPGGGGYDDSRGVKRYQPRVSVSGGGSYR